MTSRWEHEKDQLLDPNRIPVKARTHAICPACWMKEKGDVEPRRSSLRITVKCCFCGGHTEEGIYIARDHKATPCQGRGGIHENHA